jgi:hypothetical protein
MADPAAEGPSESGLDFIDNSSLSYFIPLATDFNLEETFKDTRESAQAVFAEIERRESLFFGTDGP